MVHEMKNATKRLISPTDKATFWATGDWTKKRRAPSTFGHSAKKKSIINSKFSNPKNQKKRSKSKYDQTWCNYSMLIIPNFQNSKSKKKSYGIRSRENNFQDWWWGRSRLRLVAEKREKVPSGHKLEPSYNSYRYSSANRSKHYM